MALMVYYATQEGYGPFMQHENALIHRLCPYYGKGFDMPFSIIACGNTYGGLYELLNYFTFLQDDDLQVGDKIIVAIERFNYERRLVTGRIMNKL